MRHFQNDVFRLLVRTLLLSPSINSFVAVHLFLVRICVFGEFISFGIWFSFIAFRPNAILNGDLLACCA